MTNAANGNGSSTDTAVWRSRHQSLLKIADEIKNEMSAGEGAAAADGEVAPIDAAQKARGPETLLYGQPGAEQFQAEYEKQQLATCRTLLDLLRDFTGKGSDFLEASPERVERFSRRYLWRKMLNEASADLQIIEAAYEQRLQSGGRKLIQTQNVFVGDIVSEHALGQAVDNGFLPPTPIITYLTEHVTVRPVPYAAVILISIAYASMLEPVRETDGGASAARVSRDLLAIPHEIGHHIFWQANMPGSEQSVHDHLMERLQQAKIWQWDWRRAWLEELFADVFGILVAGPLMPLSFQDLLTDDPPAEFVEDNGHHPIPALRPLIQTCILRRISDGQGQPDYVHAPTLLDKQWRESVARIYPQRFENADLLQQEYILRGLGQPLSGASILAALDDVVDILLQTMGAQRPSDPPASRNHAAWRPWTSDISAKDGDLAVLYEGLKLSNFPLEERWLSYPEVTARDGESLAWWNRILGGWSVEGPEDRSGG